MNKKKSSDIEQEQMDIKKSDSIEQVLQKQEQNDVINFYDPKDTIYGFL